MSSLAYIRMKVDLRLRHADSKNRSYSIIEVDHAIREKYTAVKAQLPPAHVAESSAFTISAGGDTFTVTLAGTTYSNARDVRLQLVSTGEFLEKKTVEELDAIRNGSPSTILGVPRCFALWDDPTGVVRGRCYPGAQAAQAVNMFRNKGEYAPTSATDLDAGVIYFDEAACVALAALVAAELLLALPDDELAKRRLNRAVAQEWNAEAQRVMYQEECRRHDIEGVGRIQRWVA